MSSRAPGSTIKRMPAALAPLHHRPFRHLFIGTTANLLGNGWRILFLLYGAVLADRLPRGPLLVGSSLAGAASQAVIATLVLTDSAAIPLLMALTVINGASSSCYQPAAQALLPQTVPAESRRTALALSRIAGSSATIVGASLGGVLVAAVGPGWRLAVDALSFALAAVCFALVRVRVTPPSPSPGVVHELRVGWQEFTSRSWVWVIVVAFCFLNAGITASFTVLGPAVADSTGIGRTGWGVAVAAGSLGAVADGVLSPPGPRLRLQRPRLLPRTPPRPVRRRTRRTPPRPPSHPLRGRRAHPPRHPRHALHPRAGKHTGEMTWQAASVLEYRLWLAAVPEPLPEAEARIYWRVKDLPTPTLDEALKQADYAYVGSWQDKHLAEIPQSGRCPAVRIFDWLFYRGTIDCYQAPILDARLRDELIELHQPRPNDLPAESTNTDELATFLTAHLGWHLLPEEPPPPTTTPPQATSGSRADDQDG
ncbi:MULTISPECIES: MFS transporter [Streptomyces]|uniref:MFS transporter n=1 Tax=Streptomyces koelreuteriae TaxID=2838015 RepID=A0ABX8FKD0_9ACTN|nr:MULTISPECIES: MFS transporter [Streptomyces]QWB21562.1 MFS transporter [Streptomyces koelreuteriae]UUA04485.1 MFS transporter [Streptomyces koelreuteriae]UUA12110.1 MFS transporter [Streptomyces sp. CRCS-T-1]